MIIYIFLLVASFSLIVNEVKIQKQGLLKLWKTMLVID